MLREEELLKKIKLKIKSKALTTMNIKDNSKSNIFYENFINTSTKNAFNYTTTNINKKNVNGEKKIFINNIINVNNTNENCNNIQNNITNNNNDYNNCYSYRFLGGDKIKSFKNKIIGISSNASGLDNSFTNQSQRVLYQNKLAKVKLQLRDIILNNNSKIKNENKLKNIKTNIIKKNNLIKYHKINTKYLKIDKEILLNKYKKITRNKSRINY